MRQEKNILIVSPVLWNTPSLHCTSFIKVEASVHTKVSRGFLYTLFYTLHLLSQFVYSVFVAIDCTFCSQPTVRPPSRSDFAYLET